MTECYSARCQQDRKLARREFNKWTKNLLLQIGFETIAKNHCDFDVNPFNQIDEISEQLPVDFNPNQACLFCQNRQDYSGKKKSIPAIDDDENAPLDLSLKSTPNKSPSIPANNRTNAKFVLTQPTVRESSIRGFFLDHDHSLISSQIYHRCMIKKNSIVLCRTWLLVN